MHHIRLLAIEYGATIVYTSGKTNCNLTILYDYICHILFNFDLVHKPNLIDKEAYFIPAGYDNLELLKSNDDQKNKNYLRETYEKRITPVIRKTIQEDDIQCEDTNTFFENLKQLGVKGKDKIVKKQLTGTNSFAEYKKNNFDITDIKNYETNINKGSSKNTISLINKEKKFADKKKELRDQIGNTSFTKRDIKDLKDLKDNKDNKDKKEINEPKKQKIREAMLAKLKKEKLTKGVGKK